ncbi:integration host factor subunit alpha [Avibacterium sp. 21-586]|uniref:integration host factor subunit alpha n=1 Tax=Avibacterium sp. 21-586 TaxID=2911534 RepID=UPI002245A11B|nr:integration host factor subunit alpha [Avibacterium sp. 21-586]MCW9709681.1 integration host factor subunit alpha [Avibacterium sp. 21-586]
MTLTKVELADSLIEKYNLNKRDAKLLVESFFEEIRVALENRQDVKLSGFGNFELRDKASRPGRNPKTGESVPVSARRVVVFKPGQKLRSRVEKSKPKA